MATSFKAIKTELNGRDSLESLDSQTLTKFCQELQIKSSGTKKDLIERLIKSSILKSFSSEVTRTATLLFVDNIPQKGFCECPVGKCGLCCHVIVILLQLEHLTNFNELFLSLTCTQKLQKWHRPTKGDKRNIRSASHIRLKYFRNARSARQVVTQRRQKKRVATTPEKVDSRIDKPKHC